MEEAHAQLVLEPPDRLRQRGLGDADRRRSGRKAAFVDDSEHVVDLAQLHR